MLQALKRSAFGVAAIRAHAALGTITFPGSANYWDRRYTRGGNSGAGSYGRLAEFKANVVNGLVVELGVSSVIEFGCGDGNQLLLSSYPQYRGIDVSPAAVQLCRRVASREGYSFEVSGDHDGATAALSLSMDVIYHLIENDIYESYMRQLFDAAERFVLIYACNRVDRSLHNCHIRTRRFSDWIAQHRPAWTCVRHIPNAHPFKPQQSDTSFCDFYLYAKS